MPARAESEVVSPEAGLAGRLVVRDKLSDEKVLLPSVPRPLADWEKVEGQTAINPFTSVPEASEASKMRRVQLPVRHFFLMGIDAFPLCVVFVWNLITDAVGWSKFVDFLGGVNLVGCFFFWGGGVACAAFAVMIY